MAKPLPLSNADFPLPEYHQRLLAWYERENRDLPWRRDRTPYAVWVSEIMLQQTQVRSVIPYFQRFMQVLPGITELADADLSLVLKLWEGLGYYARARNLHAAARQIAQEHGSRFPSTMQSVSRLPGIGPYTAAAILSISFGQKLAVVDGNVNRVLARLFRIDTPPRSHQGKKLFARISDSLLDGDNPGDYNQALMELGALVCQPRNPDCHACPLNSLCLAARHRDPHDYPRKTPKRPRPHHIVAVGVIWRDKKLLIARRLEKAMLGGLWEFPGGKVETGETPQEAVVREIREETGIECRSIEKIGEIEHGYTHFSITLHAFHCQHTSGEPQTLGCSDVRWICPSELEDYAFPRANSKLFVKLQHPPTWALEGDPGV
ncbi:A/G-specific adenine glycosylase [candidate division KSB1 bacterium]|nr:A/G-specific adenine glycosylase [candidate division KSB1 bacterium]